MGEVFAGRTRETDQPVAIKYLRAEFAEDSEIVARFIQERTILLTIRGPHVVSVRDLVLDDDRLAIVMELVDGKDLRDLLDKRGPFPEQEAIDLCAQVLEGLAEVHHAGIIHRDVKPENVLVAVGDDGTLTAKITDFGIARIAQGQSITRMSGLIGTPAYMAPELAFQEQVTAAVDVYAVGIMCYELITAHTPFTSANAYAMLRQHVDEQPTKPPEMSDALWAVVARMLAKQAADRPSAGDAAAQLRVLVPATSSPLAATAGEVAWKDGPAQPGAPAAQTLHASDVAAAAAGSGFAATSLPGRATSSPPGETSFPGRQAVGSAAYAARTVRRDRRQHRHPSRRNQPAESPRQHPAAATQRHGRGSRRRRAAVAPSQAQSSRNRRCCDADRGRRCGGLCVRGRQRG